MMHASSRWYSIGEMASLFGLTRQTLIYYDKIGLFHPATVNDDGYRLYLPTQIPTLRLICLLKDLGIELKEIDEVLDSRNIPELTEYLAARRAEIGKRIDKLESQRLLIDQRIAYCQSVDRWRDVTNTPILKQFDERLVVTERFSEDVLTREVLHPTLMRSMRKLRVVEEGVPVDGFGTMLGEVDPESADLRAFESSDEDGAPEGETGDRRSVPHLYRPIATFTVVPSGVDPAKLTDVVMLPKGLYACMSYWGMPYQSYAATRLMSWLDEHNFKPLGNAFDFCLLDTTSYNDIHQEDFCCIQVMVAF